MEKEEFEILAGHLRPKLVRRSRSVIGDSPAADDMAQDTLLKLWTMRDRLGEYSSVEALAMVMVYRLSMNQLRDRTARRKVNDGCDSQAASLSPEDEMIDRENSDEVYSFIDRLPEHQRIILRMKHIEGLETSEIARIIGSTPGSVRVSLSRARNRIMEFFTDSLKK